MQLGLKCILFNFIAMYPSELNVHAYVGPMPPLLTQKREKKRRLDNTVVQSLLVTTTEGQDEGTNSGGTNTKWTGSIPYAIQPDGSRSLPAIGTLPSEVRSTILHHGTCRPKVPLAISSANGNRRMLSEAHYHAHSGAMEMERQWPGFSSTTKKPSGKSCWLLRRSIGNAKRVGQWCVRQTEELRSEDQIDIACPRMVRYQLIMFNDVRV